MQDLLCIQRALAWPLSGECAEAHAVLPSPQGPLLRWLKVNFSEAFIAWIHIKALRVFVESVLRCVLGILGWRGERQGLEGKLGNSSAPCSPPALLPFAFCDHVLAIFSILSKESPLAMCVQFSRARSLLPDLFVCSAFPTCVPYTGPMCYCRAPGPPGRRPQTVLFLHPPKGRSPGSSPLKEESYTCKHYFISSSVILKLIEPLWKIWKPYRQAQV